MNRIKLIYGRICHAIWFLMPDRIAFGTKLGSHLLSWAGYWVNEPAKRRAK